eukprot:11551004-Heterocapsa_arctica.AAC.1
MRSPSVVISSHTCGPGRSCPTRCPGRSHWSTRGAVPPAAPHVASRISKWRLRSNSTNRGPGIDF